MFNGIFGMAKGSNFLKFALDTIKLNYEKTPNYAARWVPGKTGPVFFTSIFVSVIHRQLGRQHKSNKFTLIVTQ